MSSEEKQYGEYEGGCHCGYIAFSMKLSPPLEEYKINNYPYQSDIKWHNDSKARCSVYQFNTKKKDHLFCPKCGCSICIDFREVHDPPRYGFSARTINNVDLDKLNIVKSDGLGGVEPAEDLSGVEHPQGQ